MHEPVHPGAVHPGADHCGTASSGGREPSVGDVIAAGARRARALRAMVRTADPLVAAAMARRAAELELATLVLALRTGERSPAPQVRSAPVGPSGRAA